jgi:small-conductance mechanosensitive channel
LSFFSQIHLIDEVSFNPYVPEHAVHKMKSMKLSAIVLSVFMLIGMSTKSFAQVFSTSSGEEGASPDVSLLDSPEAVTQLVARLSDKEVRELLLQQLDVVAARQAVSADSEAQSIFSLVTTSVPLSINRAVRTLPNLIKGQRNVFRTFLGKLGENGRWKLFGGFLGVLFIGIAVELFVRLLTRKFRSVIDKTSDDYTLGQVFKLLSRRLLLDLSGLLAFMVVTQLAINILIEEPGQFVAHHFLWNLVLIPRLFSVIVKFVLAPERSDLRLIHTSDASAKFLHRHLVGVVMLIGLTLTMFDVRDASGITQHGATNIGFWFNLVIHFYFAFIAWRARNIFTEILNGPNNDATPMEQRVAKWYPYYAMTVVVSSWLLVEVLAAQQQMHLLAKGAQYSTMLILLLAPFLDTTIRALVRHLTPQITGDGTVARKAHHSTMRCYIRMARVVSVMLVLFFISRIWELNLTDMSSSNIGADSAKKFLDFIGINAVGYLVWEISTLILTKGLANETPESDADEAGMPSGNEGGVGGSRLSTVLPLVIWFVQSIIVVMTLLVSLGHVGIDTTPLLAGAGIVGIAIGFGAQTLVGDIVSGLFFLIDDAFRAGEYVNVEGTVGTVERISLRAMQLRHHRGAIHTIPYGEIPKITNYSRDWTIMKLTFTVPFETDLIKVKRIFKKIGTDLLEHPQFADDFISPFKSQGVINVDDVGIVIRGKFMVKPGKQFMIRKEIFQRIQRDFEENGIQFARKEVRVKVDSDTAQLSKAESQAVGAAALEASEKKPAV